MQLKKIIGKSTFVCTLSAIVYFLLELSVQFLEYFYFYLSSLYLHFY